MAQNTCSTCRRSSVDLGPGHGLSGTHEVSLSSLHYSASSGCSLCAFVRELLAQDVTTPKADDMSYQSVKVRVDEWGLRFTGQWQGALVIEIYRPGRFPTLVCLKPFGLS